MADYIPQKKDELITWGQNFVTYLQTNLITLGLTLAEITPVVNALGLLITEYGNQTQAANEAQAATNAAAAEFDSQTRPLAQQLQVSPTVSDPEREAMGLRVYDTIRTAVAAPTTRPVFEIDISDRLRHILKFRDEATPDSRKKPAGVREAEIWHKIADAQPASQNDYLYLAGDSATPYVAEFDNTDAGKTVWYIMRWKSTRGETGPWSFPLSAKVPA